MDYINSNDTPGNPTTSEDRVMADSVSPSPRANPTFTSASETQTEISHLHASIASNWAVASAASSFPYQYLPGSFSFSPSPLFSYYTASPTDLPS
jgi:hypothetical protein